MIGRGPRARAAAIPIDAAIPIGPAIASPPHRVTKIVTPPGDR